MKRFIDRISSHLENGYHRHGSFRPQSRETIGDKLVKYIEVLRSAKSIDDFYNKTYVTAINCIKTKLKDAQKNPEDRDDYENKILSNDVVQLLSDILVDLLSKDDDPELKGIRHFSKCQYNTIFRTLFCLNDLIESSEQIAKSTIPQNGEWKLLPLLKTLLESMSCDAIYDGSFTLEKNVLTFLQNVVIMLYNLAMHDNSEIIHYLFERNIIEVIRPYIQSPDKKLKIFSILFILYVSNERKACLDKTIIEELLQLAMKAFESENKKTNGFKSTELLRAIEKSSNLDASKAILYDLGVIQNMAHILEKTDDDAEIISCLCILTNLGFIETGLRQQVLGEIESQLRNLINQKIMNHTNNDVVQAGQCLNWVLEEQASSSCDTDTSSCPLKDKHIMISYNWGSQKKVRVIKKYLKEQKLKIWYDEDEMVGDSLTAMAAAVEQAWAIIVCTSRKYKQSVFCQMEAKYAVQRKVKVIPVRVEDYVPDGWLGILTHTKLYYDFTSSVTEEELQRLIRELRTTGDSTDGATVELTTSIGKFERRISFLIHWKEADLEEWFYKIGIDRRKLGVNKATDVRTLIRMHKEAPDSFYRYMFSKEMSLSQITNFIDGFDELRLSRQNI